MNICSYITKTLGLFHMVEAIFQTLGSAWYVILVWRKEIFKDVDSQTFDFAKTWSPAHWPVFQYFRTLYVWGSRRNVLAVFFHIVLFWKVFFFRRTTHPSIPNRRFLKRHLLGGAIPFSRDSYIKIFSLRENVIKPLNASFAERKIRIFIVFQKPISHQFFSKLKYRYIP